jgi:hypothetical protein
MANDSTIFRLSFLTIIHQSGIIVFAAPPQAFDEAKGMIEDRGIVRQRHAAQIAVLAIESPDIEKIPSHSHSLTPIDVGQLRFGCKAR